MSSSDLSTWFERRPHWLKEAARRLLDKKGLTEQDIFELAELCRKEAVGATEEVEYTFPSDVFKATTSKSLRLCSIGDVKNINALAPRNPLRFGEGNLSIVYGQTGSGKSGYVRILKHACGARSPGALLSNLYSPGASPQQCSISYDQNGSVISCQWTANVGIITDLRTIDIYDASCGRVYVTHENDVTYEPPVLSFFSDLIAGCERVAKAIDAEMAMLSSNKALLPPDYASTEPGQWYSTLSKDTAIEDIKEHCAWENGSDKELTDLDKRLSEQAPADTAKQLRTQKLHADALILSIESLLEKLSDANCRRILELRTQFVLKEKAAKTAAEQVFKDAPLAGVGSDVWRLLWEQARKYSEEQAYRGIAFPYAGDGARCVLCQQLLSGEANERFLSFEGFVKGALQKNAETAKKELDDAVASIGDLPSSEMVATKAHAGGLTRDEDASVLEQCYSALQNRKDQLLKVESVEDMGAMPQCRKWMDGARRQSSNYEESAQKYEEDARKDNRAELGSKRLEFQARKWLSQQRKSVEEEIGRLKHIDALQAARRLTDTAVLSKKKGALAEQLITAAFVNRFAGELKNLGADRIKIELAKTRVEKGRVLHRLRLRGTSTGAPEDVLSEGEYRIVSLAAFFADVAEKQNLAPFVFDDPISSLDQDFEEAVVKRLVELSKERQVIVFTHRLSLLGLLQDAAKNAGCEPYVICVRQESWGTGEPGETPLFVKKPEKALNSLINDRLPRARKALSEEGQECYVPIAKSICTDYRILLERMIECHLLADVVQRYRRALNTTGKIDKLAQIKDCDCEFFDAMMTKYSRYEHSQPGELPVALPAPDELQHDMETLRKWYEEFENR
jgi:energy-coupling factor transporter ATP-binding protein EcfA2